MRGGEGNPIRTGAGQPYRRGVGVRFGRAASHFGKQVLCAAHHIR